MQEEKQPSSLESLDSRIKAAKKRHEDSDQYSGRNGAGDAMRVGVELMAGILVGAFAGFWLDRWLGTSPLFFLSCFALGVAGSGLNIYRMSKRVSDDDATDDA